MVSMHQNALNIYLILVCNLYEHVALIWLTYLLIIKQAFKYKLWFHIATETSLDKMACYVEYQATKEFE